MNLTELAVLLLTVNLEGHAPTDENRRVALAMAQAVLADPADPITGTKEGDLALGIQFARRESDFRILKNGQCITGDGGAALGPWQLQHTLPAIACRPELAAGAWLAKAHASAEACSRLAPDERMAALASGNCDHGRAVSTKRMTEARANLDRARESVMP